MQQILTAFIVGIVLLLLLLFVVLFVFLLRYARKQRLVAKIVMSQDTTKIKFDDLERIKDSVEELSDKVKDLQTNRQNKKKVNHK